LSGERGVGCDAMARYIYNNSANSGLGFVKVNCASVLSDEFRRNILRTGTNISYTDQASGGALYFDRIDELTLECQAMLQEFLPERNNSLHDLVLLSARSGLANLVGKGLFREDLYRAIKHNIIEMPSLRERGDELHRILSDLDQRSASNTKKRPLSWSTEVIDYLKKYSWPDNFYEAGRVVRVLSEAVSDGEITVADIREHLPELADAVDYGRTSSMDVPQNISMTWQRKYQTKFIEIRKSDQWDAFEQEVSQLASDLFTKITHTAGVKSGNFREYLSSEMPAAADRILRILVARRVLIAFYNAFVPSYKGDRYASYVRQLGFEASGQKDTYGQVSPDEANFKELVTEFGLKKKIIEDPLRSKGLWMEEIKWLERNAVHLNKESD